MKLIMILSAISLMAFVPAKTDTAHSFKVKAIDGGTIDLSVYKGKKILVVNTASKCGYTKQYAGLEELYKKYRTKLVVIGFPANNFGGQEPGSNEEIKEFCTSKFDVSFPMAAKVSVKGNDIDPFFKWLTNKSENGVLDANISWNFNKFLLDENGKLLQHFSSNVEPMSEAITKYLQ
ncbi:MAG: glutathione peroxidase [Chitinophagaceae bacterium]|nr:glutathione peroxidase [Chitinophagaceae bacterium]